MEPPDAGDGACCTESACPEHCVPWWPVCAGGCGRALQRLVLPLLASGMTLPIPAPVHSCSRARTVHRMSHVTMSASAIDALTQNFNILTPCVDGCNTLPTYTNSLHFL